MTLREMIEHWTHNSTFLDKQVAIALWLPEDVIFHAQSLGILLTEDEAEQIIQEVHRRQGADIGISWDVLEVFIKDYANER